jgi:hypothetical protein
VEAKKRIVKILDAEATTGRSKKEPVHKNSGTNF